MPELPEIETICRALKEKISNNIILECHFITNLKLRKTLPANITEKIINRKIIDVSRRAKYIKIILDNGNILLIHLGMSGKLLIKDDNYLYQKHDHVAFKLSNNQQIIYNDPRRFGMIDFIEQNSSILDQLGIEPLDEHFTDLFLQNILKNKQQAIKLVIMNNKFLVGVGNIYACESLFLSKISPIRSANSLTQAEIKLLRNSIIQVLEHAIKQGGSTLKDYSSISGENGYFQNFFNVYNKHGTNCALCQDIIVRVKQGGRSSFYCPTCQL
jgi:formamidopyrimidine-DNA glycosylase